MYAYMIVICNHFYMIEENSIFQLFIVHQRIKCKNTINFSIQSSHTYIIHDTVHISNPINKYHYKKTNEWRMQAYICGSLCELLFHGLECYIVLLSYNSNTKYYFNIFSTLFQILAILKINLNTHTLRCVHTLISFVFISFDSSSKTWQNSIKIAIIDIQRMH